MSTYMSTEDFLKSAAAYEKMLDYFISQENHSKNLFELRGRNGEESPIENIEGILATNCIIMEKIKHLDTLLLKKEIGILRGDMAGMVINRIRKDSGISVDEDRDLTEVKRSIYTSYPSRRWSEAKYFKNPVQETHCTGSYLVISSLKDETNNTLRKICLDDEHNLKNTPTEHAELMTERIPHKGYKMHDGKAVESEGAGITHKNQEVVTKMRRKLETKPKTYRRGLFIDNTMYGGFN